MMRYWSNGQWYDSTEQSIPVMDRGWLHGLGLFETLLAIDGKPVFVDRHFERLQSACQRLGWSFESTKLVGVMSELLVANELTQGRARIRVALSAGSGSIADVAQGDDCVITILASRADDAPLAVSAMISPWRRNEHSPLAGLKCASYAENLFALQHARESGFDEILFLNTAGELCEGATANVFLVQGAYLITPPLSSGCLPGVTRAVVMELAASMGIACREQSITVEQLNAADELFLTSSTKGVVAIIRLQDRVMQEGRLTAVLRTAWHKDTMSLFA